MSKHITLIDRLQEQASKQPQKKAFTFLADGETEIDSFTYQQLNEKAKAIASVLQTNNAEGKRALLLYQPGLEFITAFLGCLYAGVVAVPVYPPRANRSLERLLAIVTDAQAEFALTAISIQNQVASKFASNQATENIKFIATDTLELNLALNWQHPELTADSLAFLQYTSGSTGTPKGVMVSHGNLIANSISINRCFQNTREHTAVSWLPPYHDMGLIGCIIQPMYVGLSMYLMAPVTFLQRPYHWLQAISRYRGNTNGGPNFAFDLCVDRITPEQKETLDLSCWELAFSGAEPVRAETIDRFSEYFRSCGFQPSAFYPCYGMAESTLLITGGDKQVEPIVHSFDRQAIKQNRAIASRDESNKITLVGCGQNIPGQTMVIANPETLAQCQEQEIGEIWTKSKSVAQGYWNRPKQTAASFNACLTDTQEGGWLRTGDLGFLQAGELFVTGRLKDLIIIRGRNYYPQDIELTLDNAHEAIFTGNTAAFAVEIEGKEQLVVTSEIKRTHLRKLNVAEVTKAIRQALAQNHELQPYAIVLLKTGSIPKTSSGKIKRHACRADFLAGSLNVVGEYTHPSLATRRGVSPSGLDSRGVSRNAPTMSGNPQKLKASPPTAAISRNALTMSGNSQKLTIYPTRGQRPQLRGTSPHTATISRMPHTHSSGELNGETLAVGGSADITKVSNPKGLSPLLSSLSNKQPENIQNWLIENLAQSLGVSRSQIDINEPFASSGLDSVAAIKLSADLEDWLEIKLSPTLVYDYPNISELAAYFGSTQSPEPTATLPTPAKLNNSQADIAIIGIGCRFPGAKNPTEFWQLLRDGKDAITKSDRWKGSNWGGFIEDVDKFDPQFFGITPRETQRMDPQQRLLLEVSWSALENAAIANSNLAGSKTGVFVGMSSSDYSQLQLHYGTDIDAYAGTGNAHSIAANRLSYLLDLRGPSLAIDTACSSSLVAVHLASQSLKTGECDQAIVGGVNLMLSPELTQTFSLAGMMAQDGRCKTFDADADGYVRGEGCGVVILKRLADAQRDNNQILAVIKGTAINQDGRSNGLTAPNGLAQQAVIRQALANANVSPEAISYIESHGTGTSLGDPIEVNSLKAVLAQERSPKQTCYLGSLKTNIGHLEAAAGIAGLIKTVLCLQHEAIPPNLHFNQLNPLIDLENTAIAIPTQLQPWKNVDNPRLAGVSSFGFGGTNAHIVLQNSELPVSNSDFPDRPVHLLTLSAKSEPALTDLVLEYKDYLDANPEVTLADICFTASTGRTHFNHRLAIAVESKSQLRERLASFTVGDIKTGIVHSQITKNNPNKIAFLFTGQGSQYVNMGYQLYQTQSVFRQAINKCTEILSPYLDQPLIEILYPKNTEDVETTSALLDETAYTQPAIFALEYALAQMWLAWGIKPEAVIGHSVGEYVAATVAGVFSLKDGLKLVATRGKLMQALSHEGEMFAVFATEATVNSVITAFKDRVAIAAINSPQSIVISGEKTAVREVISKLDSQEIRCKQLNVSHAFHSPLMKPILPDFAAIAEKVNYSAPQIKLISNVTGKIATAEIATASYWVNHITAPVKFAQGMESLAAENCHIFLEVGSKAILLGMGRSALSTESKNETRKIDSPALAWLPSLRPRKEDWQQILQSLAYLYSREIAIDWNGFEQGYVRQKLALPTYPFQRQSYWLEKKSKSSSEEVELFLPTEKHSDIQKADFYQIEWQLKKQELKKASIDSSHHKTWVIFADGKGLGKQIAEQLEKQNQTCLLLSDYLESKLGDLEEIFKQEQNIQGVIYLWGLDNPENLNFAAINNYQQLNCTAILNLVQTLFKQSINAPIWLVTRGNQAVDNYLSESTVASSSLWGLGNAIALEHPEYWGGIIDLASDDLVSDKENNEANHLISLIANKNKEDRVVLRQDKIYVPRLLKTERIESKNPALEFAPQSFYVITGGLGALGLKIAQWLAEKGAKHLVLTGRSKPDELARKVISKLEASGVTIKVIQADISNSDDVARIINIDSTLQLKGIIHAAGILDDGLLQSQTWSRFAKVISPKVIGAWNLHQLTKDISLDFFVLFSSVASLIGSPGQSNYSVANAGLDAIARYRQSQNLPALSINWGPWADTGMAVKQGFSIKGFDLINPQMGLAAFEELLTSKLSQVGVIKADWQQLSQKFPYLQQSNFFTQLLTNLPKNKQIKSKNKILNELLATSGTDRKAYLTDYLQNAIAEILQIDPADLSITDSLLDIGMDSLMVMEAINQLKTDLQLILYPREFYEHPQISSLAGYLATEFAKTHQPATSKGVSRNAPTDRNAPTQLPLPSHHLKLPPAAFILSSPRSGSTLLRVMLAGHPNLSSPPELHLLPFQTMEEREQELGISHLGEGLKRAFMALKGINAAESQELVKNLIKENLSITEVYQMLQQLAGDRLLIDKSPTYASNRETLERAENIFDNAKYIHLVRHPYAVIESFARMRMDKLITSGNTDPYQLAELIWKDSNQNILDFSNEIDPSRYHLVHYEDLVSQPRKVMTDICNFLDVPFNEAVLHPYKGDRLTDGLHKSSMSLGDPNFRTHQQIDAQLAETWREIKLPTLLSTYAQQIANNLQYELPQEADTDFGDLPMQETLLNIRGLRICLCTWGPEEGPVVLCLHGILEQGAAWSEVAIRLAQKGYRVIAPDLRGHGRSDRVGKGGSYNLIDFLGDIDAIVENLAGKAFILVGHSLGSVLGAIFATIRPQTIKNIVLVETILPTASEDEDEDTTARLTNQLNYLASPPEHPVFPNVEAAAERLLKATPAIAKSLAMLLAERITEPCEGGVRWRWEPLLRTRAGIGLNGIGRSRYLNLLKKIRVPITLVYGDKSNFNRKEDLNKQQEAMPNAQRVVVSGGHNLPLEAPSALAKIISSAVALTTKLIP